MDIPICSYRGAGLCGGLAALRTEAILLTLLLFLGFNVAWLLLFDDRYPCAWAAAGHRP